MGEFDEDDFSDLYADVEVQASSAISAMHELREMPHKNDEVSGNVVDGFTQLPGNGHEILRRGDKEGNGLRVIEITAKNGGSFDTATEGEVVAAMAEEEGLLKLLSEDGNSHERESESEDDLDIAYDGNDGNKQKFVDNYDDNNVEFKLMNGRQHRVKETVENEKPRGKGKCVSEEGLKAGSYKSKGKHMGPFSVASSSNLKPNGPAGALWEDNSCSPLMGEGPVVRSSYNQQVSPQDRVSRRSPASPPLSFDLHKYGSIQISDSKDDNSHEVMECDLDGTAETSDGTKYANRVEPESSQSGQSQHSPAVACLSSPSDTVNSDDREKNHKHFKKYQSNSLSEKPESVICDDRRSNKSKSYGVKPIIRESRSCERDRHPLTKELKQRKRSNYVQNLKTRLYDKNEFDVMNKHYRMRSESSYTYFRGLLPYHQVGPAYMQNHIWNIYPAFGYESGWCSGHNMNAGECFIEKERPNMDYEGLEDNWYHNERRNKGLNMQFRRRTKGDDLSPPYEHNEDFTNGKFRRYEASTHCDRYRVDHRHDRNIPFDRREIKSPMRSKRRYESPLNSSNYSWHMENEYKDRKYVKNRRESGWYGSENARFDTSEGLRYIQGEGHLERRRNYHQSTNTCNITGSGSIENHYDHNRFDRKKQRQFSEVLLWDKNDYNKSRHQDDKMFQSGCWSDQFERISRDTRSDYRHENDRVLDLSNEREGNKCTHKMKRERYSSNQFEQVPKLFDPDSHLLRHLRGQDSVDPRLVGKKYTLQSSRRATEAEDEVYHSRYNFEELNDNQNFKDMNDSDPGRGAIASEGMVYAKQCDKSRNDKLSHNRTDEFLDIEEGQIITEDIHEKSMEVCEDVKQSNDVEYTKAATNGSKVEKIDDERIKEIIAKMEKRGERFREPITLKKDPAKISMHLPELVIETATGKMVRPARKRKWVGS